jgi:hypothetical protein
MVACPPPPNRPRQSGRVKSASYVADAMARAPLMTRRPAEQGGSYEGQTPVFERSSVGDQSGAVDAQHQHPE